MNCKTILVATDFSPASQAALAYATALAAGWDAKVIIAHVEQPAAAAATAEQFAAAVFPDPQVRAELFAIEPPDSRVRFEHRLLRGVASEDIPRLAEQEDADLIVMGTHGRSGIARLLLGSVAEMVLRNAKCPVLVLKAPSTDAQPAKNAAAATSTTRH